MTSKPLKQTTNVDYEFSQPPTSVPNANRGLYRDPTQPKGPANIMFDKRVIRGNTYASPVVPPSLAAEIERKAKEEEERTRRRMRETRRQAEEASRRAAGTPEPVPGRAHADIQTETFLEVISDRAPEFEIAVQTDALLDRPPTPLFVPKPRGVDRQTQIEAGELFNFDYEVAPVLEVLVGKTLETALLEVLQEDEIEAIRARQAEYESIRNAELAEVQRLEAEIKRRQSEKERRLEQERTRVRRAAEVQQKVAASAFARSCLFSMHNEVFQALRSVGYFYDPLRREIETLVLPEIFAAVESHTSLREVARQVAEDTIIEAIKQGKVKYEAYLESRKEQERLQAEEAARLAAEAAAALTAAQAPKPEGDGENEGEGDEETAPEEDS